MDCIYYLLLIIIYYRSEHYDIVHVLVCDTVYGTVARLSVAGYPVTV